MNPTLQPQTNAIAIKRAQRLASTPVSYRKLFERAWAGKASPRQAIKAQCLECVGFERVAITECTGWACPLWPLRPYQTEPERPPEDRQVAEGRGLAGFAASLKPPGGAGGSR